MRFLAKSKSISFIPKLTLKGKMDFIFCGILILSFSFLSVFVDPKLALIGILFVFIFLVLFEHIELGLYALFLTVPLVGLDIHIGVWDMNAPLADWLALLVFIVWLGRSLVLERVPVGEWLKKSFPLLTPFLFFLAFSCLSFFSTNDIGHSLKYLLRPIIFFYFMFVVLPVNILNTPLKFTRAIQMVFIMGMLISLMGMVSLLLPSSTGWPSARPLALFGVAPLGYNHNQLAEAIVVMIPFAFFFFAMEPRGRVKQFFFLSALFAATICLLTFSRAGWISLFVEFFFFLRIIYHKREVFLIPMSWDQLRQTKFAKMCLVVLIASLPFLGVMYFFHQNPGVQGSTNSRWALTKIALEGWKQHPWIGNGWGTFVSRVDTDLLFRMDFGSALESHGVLQKLLLETGLLGTVFFLLFLACVFRALWQSIDSANSVEERALRLAVFASVAGIVAFQFWDTSYFSGIMWLPIGLALAVSSYKKQV